MNVCLTDDQKLLQRTVREFAEAELRPHVMEWDEAQAFPRELNDKLAALGLMGTLIPLSPALEGLADGDVATLADNLRVAFSITVLGLLVGALAFAISLVRERLYGQDYSDLEYAAAELGRRHR